MTLGGEGSVSAITAIDTFDHHSLRVVLAGDDGRISWTSNAGQSWVALNGPPFTTDPTVHRLRVRPDGAVWCCNDRGLWATVDYGVSWQRVFRGNLIDFDLGAWLWVVLYAPTEPSPRLRVVNGGGILPYEPPTSPSSGEILAFAADKQGGDVYWIDDLGQAWFTDPDDLLYRPGRGKSLITVPLPAGPTAMQADPDFPGVVYWAAGFNGIWRTTDGFRTVEGLEQVYP